MSEERFEERLMRRRLWWWRWGAALAGVGVFGGCGFVSAPAAMLVEGWMGMLWALGACAVWGVLVWFLLHPTTPPPGWGVQEREEWGGGGRTEPPSVPPEGGRDDLVDLGGEG